MFILFNATLYNMNSVMKIHRVVSADKTLFKVILTTAMGEEITETFNTELTMNQRFKALTEVTGANACGGY